MDTSKEHTEMDTYSGPDFETHDFETFTVGETIKVREDGVTDTGRILAIDGDQVTVDFGNGPYVLGSEAASVEIAKVR